MKKHLRLLALFAVFALIIAACGDGDDAASGDTETTVTTAAPATTEGDTATTEADTTTTAAPPPADPSLICEVTDVGGVDDKGFNASAWAGAQRAAADFGGEASVLESQAETDYEVNINSFVDQDCDLIVTVGFLLGEATEVGANANPGHQLHHRGLRL